MEMVSYQSIITTELKINLNHDSLDLDFVHPRSYTDGIDRQLKCFELGPFECIK